VGRAPTDLTASERTADRAARNSAVRAVAELVAKFASLALVFVLARHVGVDGLGVYVFAFAWAEVANIPVDMGFDRFLTRQVARDRRTIDSLMANVVAVKLLRAGPVLVASFVLVNLLGYSADTCGAVYAAAVGVIFESLVNTVLAVFTGLERGGLSAVVLISQRLLAAALGLGALAAGLGVVAVLVGFAVAAASALVLAASLLVTHVGRPRLALSREGRRETRSRPSASPRRRCSPPASRVPTPSCSRSWAPPPRWASTARATGCWSPASSSLWP
jgi:O-antigen/teichoic acid export membrane protein